MYDIVPLDWSGSTSILKFRRFVCARILRHQRVVCVYCDISRSIDLNEFAATQSDLSSTMREDCPLRCTGRAACRCNRSVLAAISSTWPYNSSVYLCVSRRSSVKTVGRIELRLEADSTSRTKKFVVGPISENKCTFVSNWTRTMLPRHIDHRLSPFPLRLYPFPIFCWSFFRLPFFSVA